jgi:hypothetical protein
MEIARWTRRDVLTTVSGAAAAGALACYTRKIPSRPSTRRRIVGAGSLYLGADSWRPNRATALHP